MYTIATRRLRYGDVAYLRSVNRWLAVTGIDESHDGRYWISATDAMGEPVVEVTNRTTVAIHGRHSRHRHSNIGR